MSFGAGPFPPPSGPPKGFPPKGLKGKKKLKVPVKPTAKQVRGPQLTPAPVRGMGGLPTGY